MAQGLQAGGAHGAHQVAQVIRHGAQTHHGVHQHGEEDDQGADEHFGEHAGAEPDDQQRGHGHDGDGLRGHQIGREQPFQGVRTRQAVAQQGGQQAACQQTGDDFAEGVKGVAQQAAVRQRRPKTHGHLDGGGQNEGGQFGQSHQNLPGRQRRQQRHQQQPMAVAPQQTHSAEGEGFKGGRFHSHSSILPDGARPEQIQIRAIKKPRKRVFGAEPQAAFPAQRTAHGGYLLLSGLYRRPRNFTGSYARARSWVITTDRELGGLPPAPCPEGFVFNFTASISRGAGNVKTG